MLPYFDNFWSFLNNSLGSRSQWPFLRPRSPRWSRHSSFQERLPGMCVCVTAVSPLPPLAAPCNWSRGGGFIDQLADVHSAPCVTLLLPPGKRLPELVAWNLISTRFRFSTKRVPTSIGNTWKMRCLCRRAEQRSCWFGEKSSDILLLAFNSNKSLRFSALSDTNFWFSTLWCPLETIKH